MATFQFTDDQKATMDIFMDFLSGEDKFMVVQGAAGSGKSTLIRHMVKSAKSYCEMRNLILKDDPMEFEMQLAATTNPAVAVLEDLTGMEAKTIHSILGLKIVNNFRKGIKELQLKKDAADLHQCLLVIDEGSMINDELFEMIDKQTVDCKIVIIGDQFQLAPVNHSITVMETMLDVPKAEMNKIMRNSGIIMETGAQFRETVKTGVFHSIPDNYAELQHVTGPTFQKLMDAAFIDPNHHLKASKVLAWTNAKVLQYNNYIRTIQGFPQELTLNEVVFTNKPILNRKFHASVDSPVQITGLGARYEREEHKGIWGRKVELNSRFTAFLPENLFAVKDCLQKLAKKKTWKNYFHIKDTWLDLRLPHASTVHKAQGSSYDTVFIDLADIGRCNVASDVARMLYVSISRARKQVYLYGYLPDKYCGK